MRRSLLLVAVLSAMIISSASNARGEIPESISFQGILADTTGVVVPDGSHFFIFRLYESATGGSHVWEEWQVVQVTNGLFDVALGDSTALTVQFDVPYWLGMSIDLGLELSPRTKLTAAGYSLNARTVLDGAITGGKIADGYVVRSINSLTDEVTIAAGDNVTIVASSDTLFISATQGSGLPAPDYDSGWFQIDKGQDTILVHNLGGEPRDYSVDLQLFDEGDLGLHNRYLGGEKAYDPVIHYYGAYYKELNPVSIKIDRRSDASWCDSLRVRIWRVQ